MQDYKFTKAEKVRLVWGSLVFVSSSKLIGYWAEKQMAVYLKSIFGRNQAIKIPLCKGKRGVSEYKQRKSLSFVILVYFEIRKLAKICRFNLMQDKFLSQKWMILSKPDTGYGTNTCKKGLWINCMLWNRFWSIPEHSLLNIHGVVETLSYIISACVPISLILYFQQLIA